MQSILVWGEFSPHPPLSLVLSFCLFFYFRLFFFLSVCRYVCLYPPLSLSLSPRSCSTLQGSTCDADPLQIHSNAISNFRAASKQSVRRLPLAHFELTATAPGGPCKMICWMVGEGIPCRHKRKTDVSHEVAG